MYSVKTAVSFQEAIDDIIEAPTKQYTHKEAENLLYSCGILDKDGNICDEYKLILSESAPLDK